MFKKSSRREQKSSQIYELCSWSGNTAQKLYTVNSIDLERELCRHLWSQKWRPPFYVQPRKYTTFSECVLGYKIETIWTWLKAEKMLEYLNCSIKTSFGTVDEFQSVFLRRWKTNFALARSTFVIFSHTNMLPSDILLFPSVKQPRFYRKPGIVLWNWILLMTFWLKFPAPRNSP